MNKALLSVVSAIILSLTPTPIFALSLRELQEYSANDVYWYDPNANCISGYYQSDSDTVFLANDNGETIMGYLIQNGYSKVAAAGIVGNLYHESHFNPRVLEGGAVVSEDFIAFKNGAKTFSGAFGLVQWDDKGRVQNLQQYADQLGEKVTSLSAQLKFMLYELESYNLGPNILNQITTPEEVANIIFSKYEMPGDDSLPARQDYAAQAMSIQINDSVYSLNEEYFCLNKNLISDDLVEGFIYYNQSDPRWKNHPFGSSGTVGGSGCGPTSFAMIISNLKQQAILPDEVADIASDQYVPGQGSSWTITKKLAEHYGLQYKELPIDINAINEALADGWMIHTSGKGSAPYSPNGHYIAIFGMTTDGKWIVGNSAGSQAGVKTYTPEEVIKAGMHNVKAVKL